MDGVGCPSANLLLDATASVILMNVPAHLGGIYFLHFLIRTPRGPPVRSQCKIVFGCVCVSNPLLQPTSHTLMTSILQV